MAAVRLAFADNERPGLPDGARQNRPLIGRPVRLRRRAGEKGVLLRILSPKQELKQDLVQNRR